ncbi:MAG: TIGR03364 family FAD-dependent oxidoreductase, partial [Chitinophagales bacterium]
MKKHADTLIIGAGVVGQSIALSEALKGKKVKILDRSQKSAGASVRNFGMCWPIGQSAGFFFDIALRSKSIWEDIARHTGMYLDKKGALYIARNKAELDVLEEFVKNSAGKGYKVKMLTPDAAMKISPGLKKDGLLAAMHSKTEIILDPREALELLPVYLKERYSVDFRWETCALHIEGQNVYTSRGETLKADKIYLCNGPDFETLYPDIFMQAGITKCKLQMMRTKKQPGNWRIGPALASGLTFTNYPAFSECKSINALRKSIEKEYPEYLRWGIQVMASQMADGAITIGKSQEHGWMPEPFDKKHINELILDHLSGFFEAPVMDIAETWHAVYAKSTRGENVLVHPVNDHVTIVNALGGAGMTLAPGLAEKITSGNFRLSNFAFVS